jgi:hypothetical protein
MRYPRPAESWSVAALWHAATALPLCEAPLAMGEDGLGRRIEP